MVVLGSVAWASYSECTPTIDHSWSVKIGVSVQSNQVEGMLKNGRFCLRLEMSLHGGGNMRITSGLDHVRCKQHSMWRSCQETK